jgi:hypothetical protein
MGGGGAIIEMNDFTAHDEGHRAVRVAGRGRQHVLLLHCPGPAGRLNALSIVHSKSFSWGAFVYMGTQGA